MRYTQVDSDYDQGPNLSPHHKLIRAIIHAALIDATSTAVGNIPYRKDALAWILADLPSTPFSFLWCLDQLGRAHPSPTILAHWRKQLVALNTRETLKNRLNEIRSKFPDLKIEAPPLEVSNTK